jgi:hypothetical protein
MLFSDDLLKKYNRAFCSYLMKQSIPMPVKIDHVPVNIFLAKDNAKPTKLSLTENIPLYLYSSPTNPASVNIPNG